MGAHTFCDEVDDLPHERRPERCPLEQRSMRERTDERREHGGWRAPVPPVTSRARALVHRARRCAGPVHFSAGQRRDYGDSFTFVVIVLATFHLGLRVSPSVVQPSRGAFDPERALAAFVRGRGVRVDVMGPWNYSELMPLPLAEARATLTIDAAQPAH